MPGVARVYTDRSSSAQAAGTETSSTVWSVEEYQELVFLVAVTAASGTVEHLDIKAQTSDTNTSSATWYDLPERLQLTTTGNSTLRVKNFGKYVRTSRTVAGASSASFTYSIMLVAKT